MKKKKIPQHMQGIHKNWKHNYHKMSNKVKEIVIAIVVTSPNWPTCQVSKVLAMP